MRDVLVFMVIVREACFFSLYFSLYKMKYSWYEDGIGHRRDLSISLPRTGLFEPRTPAHD